MKMLIGSCEAKKMKSVTCSLNCQIGHTPNASILEIVHKINK